MMLASLPSAFHFTRSLAAVFSGPRIRVSPACRDGIEPPRWVGRPHFHRLMSHSAGSESIDAVVEAEKSGDVLVQYVVLRRDLIDSWPLGSVVTQGCHASVCAIWMSKDDALTAEYCSSSNIDFMHKVTLEVKGEAQILNLSDKLKAGGIDHKLWIEQPENMPTCLATKPYPKSTVSSYFKKLKLCK